MKLSVVGVYNSTHPRATESGVTYTFSPLGTLGAGWLLEIPLTSQLGFESGTLYFQRKYSASVTVDASQVTTIDGSIFEMPVAEVPFLLRYWLSRTISIGLGGYYSVGFDKILIYDSNGLNPIQQSTHDTSIENDDYGLMGSIRISIPFSSWIALLAEGRYLYGLKNAVYEPSGDQVMHFYESQFLLGLTLGSLGKGK